MSSELTPSQYYSTATPSCDEIVKAVFTNQNIDTFDGFLVEYKKYKIFMKFEDATKKRHPKWAKIVPLNRTMLVKVDEIDESHDMIRVSIAYLDDGHKEHTPEQIQKTLSEHFDENHVFESFIRGLSIANKFDFETVWSYFVHTVDVDRRNYNDDEGENLSLWKFFINNFTESRIRWIEESGIADMYGDFSDAIVELYMKKTEEKIVKLSSKIGIISNSGIGRLQVLLTEALTAIGYNHEFKYESAPNYVFESMSDVSTPEDHQAFIDNLTKIIKSKKLPIFVKTEYVAKIVV